MKTNYNEQSIVTANSYKDLSVLFMEAIKELYETHKTLYQLCGPIATNKNGTIEENLKVFDKGIDALSNLGLHVIDQMPYEPRMQEIKQKREKNLGGGYDDTILTDFYLPIFESKLVSVLVFLPGWRDSYGSCWEYLEGKKRGMKLLELVPDWEELHQAGVITSIESIVQPILESSNTGWQYDGVIKMAKDIFTKKAFDYGGMATFAVLRDESVIDQLYIKLQRTKTLQELEKKGDQSKINEGKKPEFIALINYSIMALATREYGMDTLLSATKTEVIEYYDKIVTQVRDLMLNKNHDYGEAWRSMSQFAFVDISLAKILRMKAILEKNEQTLISEGINANYHDIINYSVFALILIEEGKKTHTP